MTDDHRCEICGFPGAVVGAVLLGPGGERVYVEVHVACENSRAARLAKQRAAGRAGRN